MTERKPAERYQLYSRGYADGACCRSVRHLDEQDYMLGYEDGEIDRAKRLEQFAKEIGHTPAVLRSA